MAEPYGLPTGSAIDYGTPGFPSWVYDLANRHGLRASTYPNHQEGDRPDIGSAPNLARQNRGIDWAGDPQAMLDFAHWLVSIGPPRSPGQYGPPGLEMVIYQDPRTGERVWYPDWVSYDDDFCLVGSSMIYGPGGARPITELRAGDEVYSYSDGVAKRRRVNAAWLSGTQPVFRVRTNKRSVTASANHPFLVLRAVPEVSVPEDMRRCGTCREVKPLVDFHQNSRACKPCKREYNKLWMRDRRAGRKRGYFNPPRPSTQWELQWVRLDSLRPGDLLVQSKALSLDEDLQPKIVLPRRRRMEVAGVAVPDETVVTEDVAWLLGALIGDGSVSLTSGQIRLCMFGEYRDRAEEIVRDTWGVSRFTRNDKTGLAFTRIKVAEALLAMGYHHRCEEKRIPPAVWSWGTALQRAFLKGYHDADGRKHSDPYLDWDYTSVSRRLIEDVRALHIMLGDAAGNISSRIVKPPVIKGVQVKSTRVAYSLEVYPCEGVRASGIRSLSHDWRGISRWLEGNPDFSLAAVLDITPQGLADTYDLEVEGDHNFVADGIVVHNSGHQDHVHTRQSASLIDSAAPPGPPPEPKDTLFADVSEFQVPVDDSYPYRVLSIRSNDGTYQDHHFAENYRWCVKAADEGRLTCFIVYFYWRPNWQQSVQTHIQMVSSLGGPHPKMISMIDVESGGNPPGDFSAALNDTDAALVRWLGDARRVIAYGNIGDLNAMWPDRREDQLIIAAYGSNPSYPGKIAHQYTDGQGYGGGLPEGAPPFTRCDMNSADGYTPTAFAAACGIATAAPVPQPPPSPPPDAEVTDDALIAAIAAQLAA